MADDDREKRAFSLIHSFLHQRRWNATMHELEKESTLFFNLDYLQKCLESGLWDRAEDYLSSFTKDDDSQLTTRIFSELFNRRGLEALEWAAETKEEFLQKLNGWIKQHPLISDKLEIPHLQTSPDDLLKLVAEVGKTNIGGSSRGDATSLPNEKEPPQNKCSCLILETSKPKSKKEIFKLMYNKMGNTLLALTAGELTLWQWQSEDGESLLQATSSMKPYMFRQDIKENIDAAFKICFAISEDHNILLRAHGKDISIFRIKTSEKLASLHPLGHAARYVVFHPRDSSIILIGMDNGKILAKSLSKTNEAATSLVGHKKSVKCLAISKAHGVLVSSDSENMLFMWSLDGWKILDSRHFQIAPKMFTTGNNVGEAINHIQFDLKAEAYLLMVYDNVLATVEVFPKFKPLKLWSTSEHRITNATFSCNSEKIISCFSNGTCAIFTGTLEKLHVIGASPDLRLYPLLVAAHPLKANQFAVGYDDASVRVVEISQEILDGATSFLASFHGAMQPVTRSSFCLLATDKRWRTAQGSKLNCGSKLNSGN
ncbi:Topless family [Trema orientale]|uniref:Topless family n=1 Tax=Trema orientale TaxID=63057 RepID=A0A2P5DY81_TREOI|nr:Topless family [Trema orientale]